MGLRAHTRPSGRGTDSASGQVASKGRTRFVRPQARDALVGVTFSGTRAKRVQGALRAGHGDSMVLTGWARGAETRGRPGHALARPHEGIQGFPPCSVSAHAEEFVQT